MNSKPTKLLKVRVKERMAELKMKMPELSELTGIPKDRMYKWYSENSNPKTDDAEILEKWLRGELMEKVPRETYVEHRRNQKLIDKPGTPIFEVPQTLTNIEVYRDEHITNADFWVTIPDLRDCDYGFRAKGDSMHPLIRNRALVIGKSIADFSLIIFGDIYIVHTKNGLETVKFIHPHETDEEKVMLVPYNENARKTPVHKSEIIRLFEARAVFNPL